MHYIGISPRISKKDIANNQYEFLSINMTYCNFIKHLGYEYIILPLDLNQNLLNLCDGFLIIGGEDINPTYYSEENKGSNLEFPIIDETDFKIIDFAIENNKFVFGICRGIQVINVYFGGSLIQNIQDDTIHHQPHLIKKDTSLKIIDCFNETELVNSLHHQAINILGEDLIPLFKTNNIIEMVVHRKYKIIGVQWHPERLNLNHQKKFKYILKVLGEKYETKIN